MRQLNILAAAMIMMMTACSGLESRLTRRAAVLSAHVPDLENLESSRRYLESDFYSVLDTLINLPEGEEGSWNPDRQKKVADAVVYGVLDWMTPPPDKPLEIRRIETRQGQEGEKK